MEIEFFFDVASPYSYLASLRVDGFGRSVGVPVRWRPFLLGAVLKATGNSPPGTIPAKARWMLSDLTRQAGALGAAWSFPASFPTNTLAVQRGLVAVERRQGQQALREVAGALFAAHWGRGEDVADAAVRRRALAEAAFDPDAFEASTSEQEIKDALREVTDEAVARGAFGAPTLFVGDLMYFGNDRFDLLRHDITEAR